MAPVSVALRLVWGSTLLFLPGLVLRIMDRVEPTTRASRIMRTLGARHLLQAAAERRFGAAARRIGVGVDALHVLTDVGLAGGDRRWRRAAGTDGIVTTGFVVLGLVRARRP
jgi:hypothetical protein